MSVPSLSPLAAALAAKLTPDAEIILAGLDPVPLPSSKPHKAEASKPPADPQTPAKPVPPAPAQVVETARQLAAGRQAGIAPLMADLEQAIRNEVLPAPVRAAAAKVLTLQTPIEARVTPETIKRAVAQSGVFLETRLARPSAPAPPPDLKSALLVLRQVLRAAAPPPPTTSSSPATAPAPTAVRTAVPAAANPTAQPSAQGSQLAASYAPPPGAQLPNFDPPFASAAPRPAPAQAATQPQAQSPVIAQPPAPQTPAASPAPTAQAPQTLQSPLTQTAPAPQPAPPTSLAQTAVSSPTAGFTPPTTSPSAPAAPAGFAAPQPGSAPVETRALPQTALAPPAATPSPFEADIELAARPAPQARADTSRTAPAAAEGPPPPPVKGAPPDAQRAAQPSLPAETDPATLMRHLERATSGAIARTELFQMASLPDAPRVDGDTTTKNPSWLFEVPLATQQGPAVAQFEIEKDGSNGALGREGAAWRTRFSVDVEPLGLIHALLVLAGGKTTVTLWAERPRALERLRRDSADLAGSLEAEVTVYPGRPTAPKLPAGQFLDASS